MLKTSDRRLVTNLFLAMALAVSMLVAATMLARPALAANIAVNTTADETNFNVNCALREAIAAANADAVRGACPAGSGADTITLPAGTYTLSIGGANEDAALMGDLDTTDADGLTVSGAGARETIVQGGAAFDDRIFDNTGTTEISGLTITGGNAGSTTDGGGVSNTEGDLTLDEVSVSDNDTAGAVGGIISEGGSLDVIDSTVSGNEADGNIGGVYQEEGSASITNSTISGNRTAQNYGGVVAALTDMSIRSSTIALNTSSGPGGGIFSTVFSDTYLKNSIVYANSTADCDTASGSSIVSQGHNVDWGDSCGFTQPTDLPITDPMLDPLADNGGPTDTHALRIGSQAIDAGDSDRATDQRGEARPADGDGVGTAIDDIGAFEREAAPDTIAPTVKRVSPEEDATEVGRSKNVTATFSEAMDEGSINTDTFKLLEASTDTPVEATVSYDAAKEKAILDPDTALQRDIRYQAIVTNSVKDEAGNRLDEDPVVAGNQRKTWFFRTKN